MLSNQFPFSKSQSYGKNEGGLNPNLWGSNVPWPNTNPNYNAGFNSNSQDTTNLNKGWVNNWGSNNNQGFTNNSSQQQGSWGTPIQNNWGNNNTNNNSNWGNNNGGFGNVGSKQPPIPFQQSSNLSGIFFNLSVETIAKAQKHVG